MEMPAMAPQGGTLRDFGSPGVQAGENRRKVKVLIAPRTHLSSQSIQMDVFDQTSM